jgi:hypothetical protein
MEPSSPPTCPPHHWLIAGEDTSQQWTCQRCGAERAHQDTSDEAINRPWRGFRGTRPPPPAPPGK